jgi:hypothetical protein
MNGTAGTYLAYLMITVPLAIWVATTLSRNGRVFLHDGVVHFRNVYVFNAIRRRSRAESLRTPRLPPQWYQPPGTPFG